MPHFFVDDQFPNSEEVLAIPARHRLAAVGLWTLCGAWSANRLTDGFIPDEVLRRFGATKTLIDCLINDASLFEPHTQGTTQGMQMTNWTRWQRTRASVKAYRAKQAEKQRKLRKRRKPRPTSEDAEAYPSDTHGYEKPRTQGSSQTPVPKPKSYGNFGGETNVSNGQACEQKPPPEFCSTHMPNGTAAPCGACGAAKQRRQTWETEQRRKQSEQRAAARAVRDACPDCDELGWLLHTDDAIHCDHSAVTNAQY